MCGASSSIPNAASAADSAKSPAPLNTRFLKTRYRHSSNLRFLAHASMWHRAPKPRPHFPIGAATAIRHRVNRSAPPERLRGMTLRAWFWSTRDGASGAPCVRLCALSTSSPSTHCLPAPMRRRRSWSSAMGVRLVSREASSPHASKLVKLTPSSSVSSTSCWPRRCSAKQEQFSPRPVPRPPAGSRIRCSAWHGFGRATTTLADHAAAQGGTP